MAESDDKLKTAIKDKDIDQITVAQAMLEAAHKKIADANTVISDIKVRRTKLQNEEAAVAKRETSVKKHRTH